MMKKKLLAMAISATVICSTLVNASASDVIEQDGLVYAPDHSIFFIDVGSNYSWALQAIDYLANSGIINGKEYCVYNPSDNLTRAEFITMLSRAYNMNKYANDNNFNDVDSDKYYFDAVSAGKNLGIIDGDSKGNFNPDAPLSRQDAMVILKRTLEKTGINFDTSALKAYKDSSSIASYANDSVLALTHANLVSGTDGNINPTKPITRAEVATLLYRSLMLESNGLGQPVYVSRPNIVNLCVGNTFYPNVTITNAEKDEMFSGLYDCSKLYKQGDKFYAEIDESTDMNQQISWKDGILYVNGIAMDVAEKMTSICTEPYSVLASEPVSTGTDFTKAAVSVQDGVVTAIYYSK